MEEWWRRISVMMVFAGVVMLVGFCGRGHQVLTGDNDAASFLLFRDLVGDRGVMGFDVAKESGEKALRLKALAGEFLAIVRRSPVIKPMASS